MKLLALDTATAACSVALWADGAIRARRFEAMARGHAEALMPMLRATLDEAGTGFAVLDAVAVTVGPGAFTGIRIGLAAARGIALAAGLPCFGVTTLEAVAAGVPATERGEDPLLVALETKRTDLYLQLFAADGVAIGAPEARAPERLAGQLPAGPLTVAGDGARRALDALAAAGREARPATAPGLPDAARVALLAAQRWETGVRPETPPAPLYLRAPDVTVSAGSGALRP